MSHQLRRGHPIRARASLVLLTVVVLTACAGQTATTAATRTVAPVSPTPAAFAVLVADTAVGPSASGGRIVLVGSDGQIAASVDATLHSEAGFLYPRISTSTTRVYYRDGCCDVRFLMPSGSTGLATRLPGSATADAIFAVSPDDRRIGVAVIDHTVGDNPVPTHVQVYVEDLGGGHRTQVFQSATDFVWPVGWRGGSLVVAVGPVAVQAAAPNPYAANGGFAQIDSATGALTRVLSAGSCFITGPLVAAGSACRGQQWADVDWSGRIVRSFAQAAGDYGALSPRGDMVAIGGGAGGASSAGFQGVLTPARRIPVQNPGTWWDPGWIDDTHVLFRMSPPFVKTSAPSNAPAASADQEFLLDVTSQSMVKVAFLGHYAGRLPANLGSPSRS